MPNIVITEGLDKPWELSKTELNVTKDTNLDNIDLTNQVVGQLAYTSSELLTGLTKEKDNLDKIVDAIDSVTKEIGMFPDRIAKWDSPQKLDLSDSVLGVISTPVPRQVIATARDVTDLNLLNGKPVNFLGSATSGLADEQNYIKTLSQLIAVKPLMDATGINLVNYGYVYLSQTSFGDINSDLASWSTGPTIVEASLNGPIEPGDMVVYRKTDGQPLNYRLYFLDSLGRLDYNSIPPSQVFPFAVPDSPAELQKWRDAVTNLDILNATKSLSSSVGLPEGATPPVTTLGLNLEKYSDRARYTAVLATPNADGTVTTIPASAIDIFGSYPPLSPPTLDLNKMTKSDVGKFFQEPGTNRIFYIDDVTTDGKIYYRLVTAKEPFINAMTDDIKKNLRGEYAEKQILLTQRSTDQTVFVNSISQRYTTFSDMATNLLKTLMNFYNDVARNIRS